MTDPTPTVHVDLDGETSDCSLADFLAANLDGLGVSELDAISRFDVGASFSGGGGAAPPWTVSRTA